MFGLLTDSEDLIVRFYEKYVPCFLDHKVQYQKLNASFSFFIHEAHQTKQNLDNSNRIKFFHNNS